jgi:mono/diheme cytochrome c family protein
MRWRPLYGFCVLALCARAGAEGTVFSPEDVAFFENKVRPVLTENCHECHGAKKQEAGLRLDSRASMLKGSDNGPVVTPGEPDSSLLVAAVRRGGDVEMPPEKALPAEAVAALEEWVRRGLPWPVDDPATNAHALDPSTHWAFQPIRRPSVPPVNDTAWPRNAVDRFILARQEAAGLQPAPPADRKTLIRRASFLLLGLPPTPEEVAAFEQDASPNAYAAMIDRLLASPRYGERWGRYWLDVARYADTKGYVFFEEKKYPWAYTYRDYVVEALNEDLPYDRFITEQIAADQLDLGDDRARLRALGFLTVGGHFMNNVHDIQDDRIDVVTRGLMGLTVTCARCHDHKFDPVTQADYYGLYGVFRSCDEPLIPPLYTPPPDTDEYRSFDAELAKRLAALDEFITKKHTELVTSARERVGEYLMEAYNTKDQPSTEGFMLLNDPGDLHPFVTLRWWVYLDRAKREFDPIWSAWHEFAALPSDEFATQSAATCERLRNRDPAEPPCNSLVLQALTEPPPQTMQEVADRLAALLKETETQWATVKQHAVESGAPEPTGLDDPDREQLRLVFHGETAPPNVPLASGWGFLTLLPDRPAQGEFEKLLKEVEQWSMTGAGAPPRAMVLLDSPEPYQPRVFIRGNADRQGADVPRSFPAFLDQDGGPFTHGSGRLDLARHIASPDNPLTARVLVNRVWLHHFGVGLVTTPGDFGLRCEPPSHPELLDWLASEFMAHSWSLKWLHRQILFSATWRQGPATDPATIARAHDVDADNRLLWQRTARRLDFEATRDALLAVSGRLDDALGGPALDLFADPTPPRRALYGVMDRLDMPNLLRTFDVPTPDTTSPQRDTTTVASQALFLMNGPWTRTAAADLLNRPDVRSASSTGERIRRVYQLLFSRAPTDDEQQMAAEYLGEDSITEEAWVRLIHALLLTNEFVFVD